MDRGRAERFQEALTAYGLYDLGNAGEPFTWTNGQYDGDLILQRLDRFIASAEWVARMPMYRVYHRYMDKSDHRAVVLDDGGRWGARWKRSSCFRWERIWEAFEGCKERVVASWEEVWRNGLRVKKGGCMEALKKTTAALKKWSRDEVPNIERKIEEVRGRCEEEGRMVCRGELEEVVKAREELRRLSSLQMALWKQRSKEENMKEGVEGVPFHKGEATMKKK